MYNNKIVVYTSGTFDMFHSNHLKMIEYARGLGDTLIVGVSTDELVASYKNLPIIPFEERIAIIKALKYPDIVIPQRSLDHTEIVKKLNIDVFVVGDDWVGKYDYLKELGVTVFYFPRGEGASTTSIKKTILERYEGTIRQIDHQPNPDVIKYDSEERNYAIGPGGTSGMGLGVAKMLLGKGYYVFATYVGPDFEEKMDNFEAHKVDQTNRNEVYRFIEYVKSNTDHLDCIVCNAGMTIRRSFTEMRDEEWDAMMEVAVNSHYIMLRGFFPMIPQGSRILFTGSQMGLDPHATVLAYGVTKAAVHALCKNLVKEFEGTGTTVNAIVPGFVDTPWQAAKPEEIKQNIYKKTAIHRFASVDEIVDAFRFCIDNPFVNGSLIEVNGGYCYK